MPEGLSAQEVGDQAAINATIDKRTASAIETRRTRRSWASSWPSALACSAISLSTFEAWFTPYTAHNQKAMTLAEHRFRPEFRVAFAACTQLPGPPT